MTTTSGPCLVCGAWHDRACVRLPQALLLSLACELKRQGGLNTTRPADQTPTCRRGHPQTPENVYTTTHGYPHWGRYPGEECKVCRLARKLRDRRRLARLGAD